MYAETPLTHSAALWRSYGADPAVIPADGCVDLILSGDEVAVAGPSTRWIATRADGGEGSLGVRLAPGTGARALGVDVREISDRLVPLGDLVPPQEVRRWRAVLLHTRATATPDLVERALGPGEGWADAVRDRAAGGASADNVVRELGWSERTFRRQMQRSFGYGYATLVRIRRGQHAHRLLTVGMTPAEAAARAGYADQPHLSRELRRLAGVSPAQLVGASSANRSTALPSGSSSVA
ncbi:helix-turn-helix domain-containing protein [Pimelobacter simplex]|uniref:helix-turn-helix domain-containing protein n=1 Tax=Nocardioides simplex TaxID=2045 RepID=UPI003AB0A5EB